jgi:hypothetical protein
MRLVKVVTTGELRVGDLVEWPGGPRSVEALAATGRPAIFGNGEEWDLTLRSAGGELSELRSATSDRWTRL